MHTSKIATELVKRGADLFHAKKKYVRFTGEAGPDRLLNSTKTYPHAFVLACLMDRQVKAERAWLIPFKIRERLGSFEFSDLKALSEKRWIRLMSKPSPLHRFPTRFGSEAFHPTRHINHHYDGDASRIWSKRVSSAIIVSRFLEFKGVGPKVATMATNILARDFKVAMSDYFSIDISVDVHVKRVFRRLGIIDQTATNDQVVYIARGINPKFPGLLDFPAWEIGRKWCKAGQPQCQHCYMKRLCPTAG